MAYLLMFGGLRMIYHLSQAQGLGNLQKEQQMLATALLQQIGDSTNSWDANSVYTAGSIVLGSNKQML